MTTPVLRVEDLTVHFQRRLRGRQRTVFAVDNVGFEIREAETLALVGESGCGKTTTGRAIVGLALPTSGRIFYGDSDVTRLTRQEWRRFRPYAQILFQESSLTLNPRRRVGDSIVEPLIIHDRVPATGLDSAIRDLVRMVGLTPSIAARYPRMLSGGQRQRVSIARALALNPRLVVADEPLAGLDLSIQAQILQLLRRLQEERGAAYLFISHDLAAVRQIAHRVAIMYLGRLVEIGSKSDIYGKALHPYTQALLSSAPRPFDRDRKHRRYPAGEPPSALEPPDGCRYNTRCPLAHGPCFNLVPPLKAYGVDHWAACWALEDPPSAARTAKAQKRAGGPRQPLTVSLRSEGGVR
jgi:oligopeptide/dipeptide ABC transporter ATP-binding protein